jgi:hypothetical protein
MASVIEILQVNGVDEDSHDFSNTLLTEIIVKNSDVIDHNL